MWNMYLKSHFSIFPLCLLNFVSYFSSVHPIGYYTSFLKGGWNVHPKGSQQLIAYWLGDVLIKGLSHQVFVASTGAPLTWVLSPSQSCPQSCSLLVRILLFAPHETTLVSRWVKGVCGRTGGGSKNVCFLTCGRCSESWTMWSVA